MSKLETEYKKLQEEMNDLKEKFRVKTKEFMRELFKEFFTKYEDVVESIFWTAYTPYFNDGEACEFSVNDVYLILNDDEDADYYEGSDLYDEDNLKSLKDDLKIVEEWEADKLAAANKHRTDYIKRYGRDPFHKDNYYGASKTEEERMLEWKPVWNMLSVKQGLEKIAYVENFINTYGDLKSDFQSVKHMIASIDENLMEDMFGDHVKVIVTKEGIEIEEYGHD